MRIRHGRISLELHELARRDGVPLLLLHSLCGSSAEWGEAPATWPGPVFALDFAGHGLSEWIVGGAYYPEMLAGDADAALAHIGNAAVAGAGVGAYVALLLAGACSAAVPAALLVSGTGLAGGGPQPDYQREFPEFAVVERRPGIADPMVRTLECDVRPVDYATAFARAAKRILLLEDTAPRPPWWEGARCSPAAESITADLPSALARLHAAARRSADD
jgi:pimeloyl-ACP methyl ester carboxylesterase